jgi:predicted RNA-binding protein associated with RNAse of E/G family
MYVEDENFRGYMSVLHMDKVSNRLWVKYEDLDLCIVDDGYMWVQHFPLDRHHALTTMINQEGRIVQWYFDIVKDFGQTAEGIPFFTDLYLDLVVVPGGRLFVKDEKELDEALDKMAITHEEYALAHRELSEVKSAVQRGEYVLLNRFDDYLKLLLE